MGVPWVAVKLHPVHLPINTGCAIYYIVIYHKEPVYVVVIVQPVESPRLFLWIDWIRGSEPWEVHGSLVRLIPNCICRTTVGFRVGVDHRSFRRLQKYI